MKKILTFSPILFAVFMSCQPDPAPLQGFEAYLWKRDNFGCKAERLQMVDTLIDQRQNLLGLNEKEIIATLGKPDVRELYKRNQKFLIYLLEPNRKCEAAASAPTRTKALYVRLSALGSSNEVFIDSF